VLQQACQQYVAWQRAMGSRAPRSISVNLSRVQLLLPRTPQVIRRTLADCGMDPKCLQLEVTESTVMSDAHAATEILNELKAIGVTIAVDDFGTGYSSLACLNQFPFDVLKIDRGFIRRLTEGRCFAALVQAVVEMSRNLDIRVVSEGIETQDQALVLQSLDCDFGQGYLFSRPMMPQDLPGFMVPRVLASMMREPA
jgi:EAL domain-containing protein (putative c-di-GMP-specific phosphodiesterase class I)